ncbi:MAG: hypothetical protein KGL67_03095 [Patescibacteria group bacterium]|nr:hypothetical protein [Patescibacteria group bacterium]
MEDPNQSNLFPKPKSEEETLKAIWAKEVRRQELTEEEKDILKKHKKSVIENINKILDPEEKKKRKELAEREKLSEQEELDRRRDTEMDNNITYGHFGPKNER